MPVTSTSDVQARVEAYERDWAWIHEQLVLGVVDCYTARDWASMARSYYIGDDQ